MDWSGGLQMKKCVISVSVPVSPMRSRSSSEGTTECSRLLIHQWKKKRQSANQWRAEDYRFTIKPSSVNVLWMDIVLCRLCIVPHLIVSLIWEDVSPSLLRDFSTAPPVHQLQPPWSHRSNWRPTSHIKKINKKIKKNINIIRHPEPYLLWV